MKDPDGEIAARARNAEDRRDFSDEIAGRETGRMRRFLPDGQAQQSQEDRNRRDRSGVATLALLERLQLFRERLDALDRASLFALAAAERQAFETQERLDTLERLAMRDAQGRRVYRTADGRAAFYDDGRRLTDEEFAAVDWRGDAPTWEQKHQADEERRRALERLDTIGTYRDRLHTARDCLESGKPLSQEELAELEFGASAVPDVVADALATSEEATVLDAGPAGTEPSDEATQAVAGQTRGQTPRR